MAQEISLLREKKGFLAHLVVYVLVNAMLIATNFIYSPETIWFFYPLIAWGVGIAMHYLFGVRWKVLLKETRGFVAHLVVYLLVNALLIAINFKYSPGTIWFFYPLLAWGIGIAMHFLFGIRWKEKE
jgi:hypothetical protein